MCASRVPEWAVFGSKMMTRFVSPVAIETCTTLTAPSIAAPKWGAAASSTQRLPLPSGMMLLTSTKCFVGCLPSAHSFHSLPGNGLKLPSGNTSTTPGVGPSQPGMEENSRPSRVMMALFQRKSGDFAISITSGGAAAD